MKTSNNENALRPVYDFELPLLEDDLGSRGFVYRLISSGSRVLDVGCDTGRFGEILKSQKQCTVDGIECDLASSMIAKTRLNQVFVRTIDGEESFNGLADYDAILFLDVIEHLRDPWSVIKGAMCALKPGGSIHIVVPNIAHFSVVRRLLRGEFEYDTHGTMDRTHIRWFTRQSLKKSLELAGYESVSINGIPQLPYLQNRSAFSIFITNQLLQFLPNQITGSIIGSAKKQLKY
jgi:2-polyprenyl-3-methyl-5-hydroxy-6-metoxy-1,4-benzoquinol methylase